VTAGRDARTVALRTTLAAALFLAASFLAACAGRGGPEGEGWVRADGPVPPSLEPIVFPNPRGAAAADMRTGDERRLAEEDAGWQEKYEVASGYAAGGYDDEAQTLVQAALALHPPEAWARRFRDLRSSLRVRRLEETLLRVDARGERDYVPFASPVDWTVRIRNVGRREVVLADPRQVEGAASASAVTLRVVRRDLDIYAAELRRTWTQTVFLQTPRAGPVRIPPGGVHEVRVRMPGPDVGEPISGLRVLEVSGTLRAALVGPDGGVDGVALPIRRGRVVAVPQNFEPLARDPLGSMETAIPAVAPPHLLVAAEFVERDDVPRGVEILARALETGDPALRTAAVGALGLLRERALGRPLAPLAEPLVRGLTRSPSRADALMEGLRRLSGATLPEDARLWKDWWQRASAAGETVRAPPAEEDEP